MNSSQTGNELEIQIFNLLKQEIENDRFWARNDCCKLHHKKGYYSRDREACIVFDVSIEVTLPGVSDYSVLVLIECKNYTHPVPVNDVEEFFAKIQQVTGANVKGILATNNSFQKGALTFAKAKGLGLLRHFSNEKFRWELKRSPSTSAVPGSWVEYDRIEKGLTTEEYRSEEFDLYCLSPRRLSNSLWDFVEDILETSGLRRDAIARIQNGTYRPVCQVQFLESEQIETLVAGVLLNLGYDDGEVSLNSICDVERERTQLTVLREKRSNESPEALLGKLTFDPPVIHIFEESIPHRGRERFTLAHELGHHFLGHSRYLTKEVVRREDVELTQNPKLGAAEVRRMEWQANFFASCLLLPRLQCVQEFFLQLGRWEIRDKGFGALFVDSQPDNVQNYFNVSNALKGKFGVSRSVVRYRLSKLGLLNMPTIP